MPPLGAPEYFSHGIGMIDIGRVLVRIIDQWFERNKSNCDYNKATIWAGKQFLTNDTMFKKGKLQFFT